ncbi:hypothetical protein GGI42DRAFT_248850 [Trichoderma sp. SZMC 28013]
MVGDAIDCAQILDFLQEQWETTLEDDDRDADAPEEVYFFSKETRLTFQRIAHDLCLAFEAVETQHRTVFHLTDKATPEVWDKYRRMAMEQRTLLTRQHPTPASWGQKNQDKEDDEHPRVKLYAYSFSICYYIYIFLVSTTISIFF